MKSKSIRTNILLFTSLGLLLLPQAASAASIAITSGPNVSLSGGVTDTIPNTFAASASSPTRAKITGTGIYTATGANSSITLSVGGILNANGPSGLTPGDTIALDYDFSFSLLGSGTVNWTITTAFDLGFFSVPGPMASGGPITSSDSAGFMDTRSAEAPTDLNNQPFTAAFTINWTGATAGDSLTITIPNNSIDFAVNPVPEPAFASLFALGGLALLRRRR